MREITATVYETSTGVRFAKKRGGGFIPLINPDEIDLNKKRLSDWPGIDRAVVGGMAELVEHLRNAL